MKDRSPSVEVTYKMGMVKKETKKMSMADILSIKE
jgi:hypothetical protein